MDEGIAQAVTLLGSTGAIEAKAKELGVSLAGITIIDPATSPLLSAYADEYYELRKAKGISQDDAKAKIQDVLFWGSMMVRRGDADAMVAGADNSTANVLTAAFQIIKTAPGVKSASSCFVMELKDKKWGANGMMIFCRLRHHPRPERRTAGRNCCGQRGELSQLHRRGTPGGHAEFQHQGFGQPPDADKVIEAVKLVKAKDPVPQGRR